MPKQEVSVYNPAGPAITYTKSNQKWTILDGVAVGSGGSETVSSAYSGSKLINKGLIYDAKYGVYFTGQKDVSVINKEGGFITGDYGVSFNNSVAMDMTLKNDGTIFGSVVDGVRSASSDGLELYNNGSIYGKSHGVNVNATPVGATTGPMIENAGLIHGDDTGIRSTTLFWLTNTIINKKGGTIAGSDDAIYIDQGRLFLDNQGTLKGDVWAAEGKDKVVNEGKIDGKVYLWGGNDTFKNKDGKAGKVFGDAGDDTFVAGDRKDKYVFIGALDAATNVDRIKNFESGKDKFFLSQGDFAALTPDGQLLGSEFHRGKTAQDADDHILYHKESGRLWYDENGDAAGGRTLFARLDEGQKLKASDFTVEEFVF